MIPFLRNLIEYMEGESSDSYSLLTACLHIKQNTGSITCADIQQLRLTKFPAMGNENTIDFGTSTIKDLIYQTADDIVVDTSLNEVNLENKITLSIAIRLKAEEYMFSKIANPNRSFSKNQTTRLLKAYKNPATCIDNKEKENNIKIIERVILMTPENIHINAFMYEPLIDISVFHLIALYKELKQL